MVASAAIVARGAEDLLDPQSLALFFVVPIVLSAIWYGLWASLGSALLSALAVNYLFVEPRYTFVVARTQDGAALLLFALVGALVSAIAARARAAALQAERRARQAHLLQRFASRLAASSSEDEIATSALESLRALTGLSAIIVSADDRHWGDGFSDPAREAARWAMSTKQPFRGSPQAPVDAPWRFWPMLFGGRCEMALGLPVAPDLSHDILSSVEQIAAQTGVAMERARVAREADDARMQVEREQLKAELLAGVSHDLRTPLSSIVFTLQSLQRFGESHPVETREELLALASAEAQRLAGMVDALLDASRIGKEGLPIHLEAAAPADLVEAACSDVAVQQGSRRISVDVPRALPLVTADVVLASRALANILSNALRYGGGGPINVSARQHEGGVEIDITDSGPGLGPEPERLFERFVRGTAGDGRTPGLGLGLAIARRFLESQGARVGAENRPGGGALFRVVFPLGMIEGADVV